MSIPGLETTQGEETRRLCDSQHHPPLPSPRRGPRQPGLKKAPGNVTFFLRRCDGRRWPRQFSCWPIQRSGMVTLPSNPEACFLPELDRIPAPFPADGAVPSASPRPQPAQLPSQGSDGCCMTPVSAQARTRAVASAGSGVQELCRTGHHPLR